MHMSELFSQADLDAAISAGHVKVQTHPEFPLRILNYTAACQWESAWTPVTRQCRGLILDDSGAVVARPFTKVHNHHEASAPAIALDEPVIVTDKVDGSLGIPYDTPDGVAIATRGSFTSEQAEHATRVWRTRYPRTPATVHGITPLFEIVYPSNRIVLDYGGLDDLVLLGGIEIQSGKYFTPGEMDGLLDWTGPVADRFEFSTYGAALAAEPRKDREGFVVMAPMSGAMVKVKQADYVELHRIVTGLNARTVWERLGGPDGDMRALIESLPDEFHGWVEEVAITLGDKWDRIIAEARRHHAEILDGLGSGWSRKDYAMEAKERPQTSLLFLLLDDRDPTAQVWKSLRPDADWRPSNLRLQSEDAA